MKNADPVMPGSVITFGCKPWPSLLRLLSAYLFIQQWYKTYLWWLEKMCHKSTF